MTRIIEINRCIECHLRIRTTDFEIGVVFLCTHAGTQGYQIPDIDTIPEFCQLEAR